MERAAESTSGKGQRIALIVLGALLLAAVIWIVLLLNAPPAAPPGGSPSGSASPTGPSGSASSSGSPGASTSASVSPTGSSSASASESAEPSATGTPGTGDLNEAEAANVVWPDPAGGVAYTEPLAAATGFAEDLAGFTDPIISEFMQGDNRSGEFEVKAAANGPVTTVMVRQMSDNNWYTIGAATSEVDVSAPEAAATIESPVLVQGRARAFEGVVQVAVHRWGSSEPLGEGNVVGSGGPDLGPFTGEIDFEDPGTGRGSLVFTVASAKDGSVWVAAALPVGFGSDDT